MAFEDAKTNFGDIGASTSDVAKLLLLEIALVNANDWFAVPYTLPAGSIASIRAFVVTNVFGERFSIQAADTGPDASRQRTSMFTMDTVNGPTNASADTSLLLLPTVPKFAESAPTERCGSYAMRLRTWCGASRKPSRSRTAIRNAVPRPRMKR